MGKSMTSTFKRSHNNNTSHQRLHHHNRGSVIGKTEGRETNESPDGDNNNKNCGGLGLSTVTRVCSSGKIRHNYHQHHNPTSGNGDGGHSKINHHQTSSGRHNMAIATQVISPSAIGGSLKVSGRRFCKHIDAEEADDDNQSLFGRKSRVPWGKLSCYGISIGVIILILTGVVLAVGYMQSEKQRIQSQKLSQAHPWSFEGVNESERVLIPTTWRPKTITMTRLTKNVTTRVPVIGIQHVIEEENDEDEDDEDEDDSVEENQNQRPPLDHKKNEGLTSIGGRSSDEGRTDSMLQVEDDEDEPEELEIYKVPQEKEQQALTTQESRKSEQSLRLLTQSMVDKERVEDDQKRDGDDEEEEEEEDQHKSPSEVKVLPPKDFEFHGFSFEFPIYNQSTTTTTNNDDKNSSSFNGFPTTTTTLSILPSPTTTAETMTPTTIKIPLLGLNFTFNPHSLSSTSSPSILSSFNQSAIIVDPSSSSSSSSQNITATVNNNFDLNFLNHFKELQGTIMNSHGPSSSTTTDESTNNHLGSSNSDDENSFNTPSSNTQLKLQTELFEEESSSSPVVADDDERNEQDLDSGDDSTMSASNKMRGRNPPSSKPSNNMYTPRPGTIPNYPDRENRLYSARTRPNKNSNHRHQNEDNDTEEFHTFYGSDQNEVRVPAPSTTTTTTTTTTPKPEFKYDFSTFTANLPTSSPTSSSSDNNKGTTGDSKSNSLTPSDTTHQFNFNFNSFQTPPSTASSTTTTTGNTGTTDSTSSSLNNSPPLNFNEYQLIPSSASSSSTSTPNTNNNDNNNHFNFDFAQLTTPAPPTGATPTPAFQLTSNPDILSKRTFNFDFDSSASSSSNFNSNPFAHLLGNQGSLTGVIGTASSTGAGLGYNNNNNFNFDTPSYNTNYGGGGGGSGGHGIIPLNLANSYIQAGNPPPLGTNQQGQTNSYNSHNNFDYAGSYSNPNPALTFPSFTQQTNYGQGGSSNGNSQPDYNTITQGIHLLSLLSGNIPQHLLDSQSSASNNQFSFQQSPTKPQYEIAALTGYGGSASTFLHNLQNAASSSSSQSSSAQSSISDTAPTLNLNSNLNLSPYVPAESRSLFTFNDLHSSKSLPATDQQTSFSQKIAVSKLPDFSNIYKKSTSSSSSEDSLPSESAPSSTLVADKASPSLSSILKLEENTLSNAVGSKGLNKKIVPEGPSSSTNIKDMEMAASDIQQTLINLIPDKPIINFSKKLLNKTTTRKSSPTENVTPEVSGKGLKSGFYTG